MRTQCVSSVTLLLAVTLASFSVHCFQIHQRDIPPRCWEASVTPVSCDHVPPFNLLPHPDDCELFYYCVSPGAAAICRQCPAHLHFNPVLLVCDRPAAAGCRANHTAAHDGPTTSVPPASIPIGNNTEVNASDVATTADDTELTTTEATAA